MKLVTEEDVLRYQARVEDWIRAETVQLNELLRTHVQLALESGTDPARVLALLRNVRRAVLEPREAA